MSALHRARKRRMPKQVRYFYGVAPELQAVLHASVFIHLAGGKQVAASGRESHLQLPCARPATDQPGIAGAAGCSMNAMIQALSARRADLRRAYLPLMSAMQAGKPVPAAVAAAAAVAAIIAC